MDKLADQREEARKKLADQVVSSLEKFESQQMSRWNCRLALRHHDHGIVSPLSSWQFSLESQETHAHERRLEFKSVCPSMARMEVS